MLIRLTPNRTIASMSPMGTRFETRQHAVSGLSSVYGRYLREMTSTAEMYEFLRRHTDLAWLPADLADKYATSDRAWRRFLADICRSAGSL